MIRLVDVYKPSNENIAVDVLYALLAERTPEQSISHRRMPTLAEHTTFVRSQPYACWYLIVDNDIERRVRCVGAIYLTKHREVGIAIFNKDQGLGYGSQALAELRRLHPHPLLANINPANERSIAFFKKHGATLIQHTYELKEE